MSRKFRAASAILGTLLHEFTGCKASWQSKEIETATGNSLGSTASPVQEGPAHEAGTAKANTEDEKTAVPQHGAADG